MKKGNIGLQDEGNSETAKKVAALILAGGLGTRLQAVVPDRPKVLAPVRGKPFLAILMDQLLRAGFSQVVLCCGYKQEQIQEVFGERYKTLKIQYSVENEPLGTGGALRYSLPLVQSADIVLAMNGDSYVDVDLSAFMDWYFEQDRNGALVLINVADTNRYGAVMLDEDERITAFVEKGEVGMGGWVNAGIYLLKKKRFETMELGKAFSLEREYFPTLTGRGLFGHRCYGRFLDIGTPKSYQRAESFFANLET